MLSGDSTCESSDLGPRNGSVLPSLDDRGGNELCREPNESLSRVLVLPRPNFETADDGDEDRDAGERAILAFFGRSNCMRSRSLPAFRPLDACEGVDPSCRALQEDEEHHHINYASEH